MLNLVLISHSKSILGSQSLTQAKIKSEELSHFIARLKGVFLPNKTQSTIIPLQITTLSLKEYVHLLMLVSYL